MSKEQMEAKDAYYQGVIANLHETLRDRFAMAAMQGYLSNPNINRVVDSEQFAKNCWSFADAMMEQRDISRTCGNSD